MTTYSTIDDLPAGTPAGTDKLEVSQGGVSRRVTFAQVGSGAVLPFLPTAGGTLTGTLNGTVASFSGEITAATPALGDNDTTVATTAFVKGQGYASGSAFLPIGGGTLTGPLAGTTAAFSGSVTMPTQTPGTANTTGATTAFVGAALAAGPTGTVTTVSVVNGNGLAGTVANPTTAPAITLSTSVTGVLKGNGTTISAAVSGGDYLAPNNPTFTGTMTGGAYAGTSATLSAAPAYPNNTTSVATTAFVTAGIAAVSGGGPFLPTGGGTLTGPLTGTAATFSGLVTANARMTVSPTLGVGVPARTSIPFDAMNLADTTGFSNIAFLRQATNPGGTNYTQLIVEQNATNVINLEVSDQAATKGTLNLQPFGGTVSIPILTGTTATFSGAVTGTSATLSAAPAYPNNTTSVATTAFVTAAATAAVSTSLKLASEVVLASTATTIDVTFPAGAKRIEVEYNVANNAAADFTAVIQMMVGGTPVAGTAYAYQTLLAVAAAPSSSAASSQAAWSLGNGLRFIGNMLPQPVGTSVWAGTLREYVQQNAGTIIIYEAAIQAGSAGVTGFRFTSSGGATSFVVGSYVRLYAVF